MTSVSCSPKAWATAELDVATARKPSSSIILAEATSQTLASSTGSPGRCRLRSAAALAARSGMCPTLPPALAIVAWDGATRSRRTAVGQLHRAGPGPGLPGQADRGAARQTLELPEAR